MAGPDDEGRPSRYRCPAAGQREPDRMPALRPGQPPRRDLAVRPAPAAVLPLQARRQGAAAAGRRPSRSAARRHGPARLPPHQGPRRRGAARARHPAGGWRQGQGARRRPRAWRPLCARHPLAVGTGRPVPGQPRLPRAGARVPRQHGLRLQALPRRLETVGPGDAGRPRRHAGLGRQARLGRPAARLHHGRQLRRLCGHDGCGHAGRAVQVRHQLGRRDRHRPVVQHPLERHQRGVEELRHEAPRGRPGHRRRADQEDLARAARQGNPHAAADGLRRRRPARAA
mmetsp:Transcript_96383/g.267809  ORF Transcript_96383/g.267809 Transcript_96383/m.267809 type:complete len:285 (-) Transcript_96383:276-1130(-)